MKRTWITIGTIFWVVFAGMLAVVWGGDRYSYESIRQDYAVREDGALENRTKETEEQFLSDPIGLEEAIRIALRNNPDSLMALARIDQAEAMIDQAEAPFYPTLGFYTEYVQGDAPSAYLFKTIDQRQLQPGTDFNEPGWFQNFETGLHGRINLFNGGKDLLNRKIAQRGLKISRLDRQAVENALVATVISVYYDLLSAADFIEIAENSLDTVASQLRIMKVRYEAGSALKSDILSLEVRFAQAQEDVLRSKNRLRMADVALGNVLGIAPEKEISVRRRPVIDSVDIPADYHQGTGLAFDRRPELKKVREQLIQSRMMADLKNSGYWPTLDLQGKYYHDDPNMEYDSDRQNWTVGMMLNWYFFTGFSTPSEGRAATAQIREMLAADRKTALNIRQDVRTAYLRMEEAEARLEVTSKSVDSAEESLKLVKKQYEGGSATVTRYLEAELARNSARISATTAYYDREKAVADVGRAVGFWTTSEIPGQDGEETGEGPGEG